MSQQSIQVTSPKVAAHRIYHSDVRSAERTSRERKLTFGQVQVLGRQTTGAKVDTSAQFFFNAKRRTYPPK